MTTLKRLIPILFIVYALNFLIWASVNPSVLERPWSGIINSVSYSGYQAGDTSHHLSDDSIKRDMDLISTRVNAVRIYGVSDGLDRIVTAAGQSNLSVNLGAWISRDPAANVREITSVVDIAKANTNVKRMIIGNESLLREDVDIDGLINLIERVKHQVDIPVSTAEPWHIWLKYPQLADHVDFITVHILPYWEGVPEAGALGYLMYRYQQLVSAFPNKHIFIGEVGWPSEGQWVKGAEPSRINQARFISDFLNLAGQEHLDYSIVEAFDEPWKRSIEGSVGAHWGLWDSDRSPKFSMSGSIRETSSWLYGFLIATALAFLPTQWFVRRNAYLRFGGQLFYAGLIQSVTSIFIWAIMAGMAEGVITRNFLTWSLLLSAQGILLALLLVDGFELTEVVWAHNRKRDFQPRTDWIPPPDAPKVSIHVPCYNEPPDMVIETLNALAALNYPNYEVLVVDNNTKDEAVWKPLEEHCAKLGPRFRFFHLPKWPGFKAGALNFALKETAPDVEVIGVIDSDYIVIPDWMRFVVPFFDQPDVAIVQGPQDYRDEHESLFKRMCYWEYAGFFHIGMVQRNERNAIIQHGTMTVIRASVLRDVLGWAEWCICEDAELGLRLFERGYQAVYLNHSMGRGLMPDNFNAYKTQRFRWAYGAVQILKRHWKALAEGDTLTEGQRYHFISGWLPWFADAAHLMFVTAGVFWSILLLFELVEFPPAVFLVPTLSTFVFKVVAGFLLYQTRIKCGWRDRLSAALAGMALSHTVARAVWQGIFTSGKPFYRTPKYADQPAAVQAFLMARQETGLLAALLICAFAVVNHFDIENQNAVIWAGMLLVQTLPYWAAIALAAVNALPTKNNAEVTAPIG